MEVVSYYERWEIIIKKKNEIVRLENGIVISEIVIGMVHGQPYKGFPKEIPHMCPQGEKKGKETFPWF
jgi:hypothetical protein